ncbi:MAG: hypothetical protein JJU36_00775 [Phycisphaeraceae bacterium]|nr:hypothetical protein [Phycisphaeraceae bacterium]
MPLPRALRGKGVMLSVRGPQGTHGVPFSVLRRLKWLSMKRPDQLADNRTGAAGDRAVASGLDD